MKAAVITGASVGIGESTASSFLAAGYHVFNLSRRSCAVEGVENIHCDLSSEDSIAAAVAAIRQTLTAPTPLALIHNACQMRKDSAEDCSSISLSEVMQTNLIAANSLNQGLIPLMAAGSSILYIGSTLSEKAVPGSFSYVISKHALIGMMRATCQDLMGSGIHTACICPGFTDTEMLRTHLGNDAQLIKTIGAMNSFERLIDPAEIAGLIDYAHHNPVINGAILHANLGQKEA